MNTAYSAGDPAVREPEQRLRGTVSCRADGEINRPVIFVSKDKLADCYRANGIARLAAFGLAL